MISVSVWALGLGPLAAAAALPRAVLVAGAPLPPSAPVFTVLHRKLQGRYALLEDPTLMKRLEVLEAPPSPERIVAEALRESLERMRRLALEEVQRTLDAAEPYVQQLPPTPDGRALLGAVCVRKAHVALLQNDLPAAETAIQRGLSADPEMTLDQAQEPPTLIELLGKVRAGLREAQRVPVRVEIQPPGATVVLAGRPQGPAPLLLSLPRGATATVWGLRPGFAPRNVSVPVAAGGKPATVQLQLWPQGREAQLFPLLQALRWTAPASRPAAARTLAEFLRVDAVVLAESGAAGKTVLRVYGRPPSPTPVPDDLVWDLGAARASSGPAVPAWVMSLAGGLAAGALIGGAVGVFVVR